MPVSRAHSQRAWSPWKLTRTLGMKNYWLVCCWLLFEVLVSEASKWLGEANKTAQPFRAGELLFWGLELGSQHPHPLAQSCLQLLLLAIQYPLLASEGNCSYMHRPIHRHIHVVKNKIFLKGQKNKYRGSFKKGKWNRKKKVPYFPWCLSWEVSVGRLRSREVLETAPWVEI